MTAASFTPGSGYGVDANESVGTLLGVEFSTSGFTTQSFSLNASGNSFTFDFGTVVLNEADNSIDAAETDGLGVTAHFTFTDPLGDTRDVLATGTATIGQVREIHVDYTLVWNPISVAFGTGGLFDIDMNSISLNGNPGSNGVISMVQTATITLRTSPNGGTQPPTAVPEPATLALMDLGLIGVATTKRRAVINRTR